MSEAVLRLGYEFAPHKQRVSTSCGGASSCCSGHRRHFAVKLANLCPPARLHSQQIQLSDPEPWFAAMQMEGMVGDLQLARDMQQRFEEWRSEQADGAAGGGGNSAAPEKSALDVTVSVLTTGFWPTYKFVDIDLPKEMLEGQAQFKVGRAVESSEPLQSLVARPANVWTSTCRPNAQAGASQSRAQRDLHTRPEQSRPLVPAGVLRHDDQEPQAGLDLLAGRGHHQGQL